jgi:hypothetical protein
VPLLPETTPAVVDPGADVVLRSRWASARRYLLTSLAMPGLVGVACAVMLALAAADIDGGQGWLALLLLTAAAPPLVFGWWIRRTGVLDPAAWLRVAFLVAGVQLLIGVIPCLGVAATAAPGAEPVVGVLFGLTWVCAAVSVVAARRAQQALLSPIVPELGATALRLTVGLRFAITAPALISAHFRIDVDRVEWTARLHRGRGIGPYVHAGVRFADLHQVVPIVLPDQPALHLWLTLPNGTPLYAQPGPALLLRSTHGQWMVPVHDPIVLAAVIHRRWSTTSDLRTSTTSQRVSGSQESSRSSWRRC